MVGSSKYLVADQGITCTQSYNIFINLYSFTTLPIADFVRKKITAVRIVKIWRHYNPPAPPNKRIFVEQVASKEIIATNKTRKTPNINSPIEELQQAPDESSSTTPDNSPSLDTDMTDASRQPKRTPSNDRDLEKERLDLIKRQRQGLSDPSHDANSNTTDPDTSTDPTSDMFTDDMIDDTTEATDGSPKLPFAPGISN
ncbi:hypothetical protein G6F56_013064 [Rhizopus delemar]|nr:hypothetical protein G6F56_013064 [Rhizopus delemar]